MSSKYFPDNKRSSVNTGNCFKALFSSTDIFSFGKTRKSTPTVIKMITKSNEFSLE